MKRIGSSRRKVRPFNYRNLFCGICFGSALFLIVNELLKPFSSTPEVAAVESVLPVSKSTNPSPTVGQLPVRRVVVDLSDFQVSVIEGQKVIAVFPVTHGRASRPTLPGDYTITSIVQNPLWDNPETPEQEALPGELGSWWMTIYQKDGGFVGFHGLPKRREQLVYNKIADSTGCLGMLDSDVKNFRNYVT